MVQGKLFFIFCSFISLILIAACGQESTSTPQNVKLAIDSTSDQLPVGDTVKEKPNPLSYSKITLNDSIRKSIQRQYTGEQFEVICALNRIDSDRLHRADSLIIPSEFLPWLQYAPFPVSWISPDSAQKIILVSYRLQAFAAYENGTLVNWGPVSMGKKKTPTPTGLFHTNWKSKKQISTENSDWILPWYFNLINSTGVSFHQFELPGFPASHSCIRLREKDAQWIYSFAEQWQLNENETRILKNGTPVLIFGTYPFGKSRPWFELLKDPHANTLTVEELNQAYQAFSNGL